MYACEKDGKFCHFYRSKSAVELCGVKPEQIVQVEIVELETPTDDCYWAWKSFSRGIVFVYKHRDAILACSPDFWKKAIKSGEGNIIPVEIRKC